MSDLIFNNLLINYDYGYRVAWQYKTDISQMSGGGEQRRARWDRPLRKFILPFNNKTIANIQKLIEFFHNHKGAYEPFYFWDNDNRYTWTVTDGNKEISGGLIDAINLEWRPVIKPVIPINISTTPNFTSDVIVKVNGEQRTANMTLYNTQGRITFDADKPASTAIITVEYSYLVRVRFATDAAEMTGTNYNLGGMNIELSEVR